MFANGVNGERLAAAKLVAGEFIIGTEHAKVEDAVEDKHKAVDVTPTHALQGNQ